MYQNHLNFVNALLATVTMFWFGVPGAELSVDSVGVSGQVTITKIERIPASPVLSDLNKYNGATPIVPTSVSA